MALGRQSQLALSLPLDIGITKNPLSDKSPAFVPAFMVKLASGVADKSVSALRIYISMVMLVITAVSAVSILYGSVRGSMIALGRNPAL